MVHPAIASLFFYGASAPVVYLFHRQNLTLGGQLVSALWGAHFLRRTLECLVVSKFNRDEKLSNVIGGIIYYVGTSCLVGYVSITNFHPLWCSTTPCYVGYTFPHVLTA
jgi:hypothetical protein